MIPAAAVNIIKPIMENPIDVLHPADSPNNLATIRTPVIIMKPIKYILLAPYLNCCSSQFSISRQ